MRSPRSFLTAFLLLGLSGLTYGQTPDALVIQHALNQGLELEFPHFQEVADVVILRGGATAEADFLFVCTGRLMWKLSSEELESVLQLEIEKELDRRSRNYEGANQERAINELRIALETALSNRLRRIDSFLAGDTATLVKFQVRLEAAGTDWIVTESKFKESDRNPLSIVDQ